jgi:hypothetical protein
MLSGEIALRSVLARRGHRHSPLPRGTIPLNFRLPVTETRGRETSGADDSTGCAGCPQTHSRPLSHATSPLLRFCGVLVTAAHSQAKSPAVPSSPVAPNSNDGGCPFGCPIMAGSIS